MRAITATFGLLTVGILLSVSLFVGLMLATAGTAIHPPLVRVAAPLACDGQFVIESSRYSYKPGHSGTEHHYYCVQLQTAVREEITLRAIFMAFLVYSAGAFVVGLLLAAPLLWWLRRKFDALPGLVRRARASMQRNGIVSTVRVVHTQAPEATATVDEADIAGRLRQLARLRDEGLISEQEYAAKKSEILAGSRQARRSVGLDDFHLDRLGRLWR